MAHRRDVTVQTRGRGLTPLTDEVQRAVADAGAREGLACVFVHHTSAGVLLCENADPQVLRDLEAFLARLVKDGDPLFAHDAEGPDDMPAHVRTVLTGSSLTLPVRGGRVDLGTWQGVYLFEHRTHPHARRISITVLG